MKTLLETLPTKVPELVLLPNSLLVLQPSATSGSGHYGLGDNPERLARLLALDFRKISEVMAFKGAKCDVSVEISAYGSPEEAKRSYDGTIRPQDFPEEPYAGGMRRIYMGETFMSGIAGYFDKYNLRVSVNPELGKERADALARKTYDAVRDLLIPPGKN